MRRSSARGSNVTAKPTTQTPNERCHIHQPVLEPVPIVSQPRASLFANGLGIFQSERCSASAGAGQVHRFITETRILFVRHARPFEKFRVMGLSVTFTIYPPLLFVGSFIHECHQHESSSRSNRIGLVHQSAGEYDT